MYAKEESSQSSFKRDFIATKDGMYLGLVIHDGGGLDAGGFVWADDVARAIIREARIGKYIDLKILNEIDFSSRLQNTDFALIAEHQRKYSNINIDSYGKDALAHVCLPYTVFVGLAEIDKIQTISKLQQIVQKGMLKNTKIGKDWHKQIICLLNVWEGLSDVKHVPAAPRKNP